MVLQYEQAIIGMMFLRRGKRKHSSKLTAGPIQIVGGEPVLADFRTHCSAHFRVPHYRIEFMLAKQPLRLGKAGGRSHFVISVRIWLPQP